jgi:hypothetical protein
LSEFEVAAGHGCQVVLDCIVETLFLYLCVCTQGINIDDERG